MKIALLFDHFGPYHLARLRGATAHAEVLGLEFRGRSRDYAWEVGKRDDVSLVTVETAGPHHFRSIKGKLAAALEAFNPDAVAVPGWSSSGALQALQWCLGRQVPTVLMTESCLHDERRKYWKDWVKSRLVGLFDAALVGGTPHNDYLNLLGMSRSRVFQGYDAIDNEHFRRGVAAIRAETQAVSQTSHFLASARFIEKKNLFRLLHAFADYRRSMLRQGVEPWRLVLLGDGELRSRIEATVKELQLAEVVTMPGFKQYEELPAYYARASAFIHASTTEQWGLVVNEAMASGLPVLVSDRCGCAPDLIKGGQNGFAFDPYDVNAIAAAMERLSQLPEEELRRMGRTSEEIIGEWGPSRFGDGLVQAASVALSQKRVRPSSLDAVLLALLAR